MPFSLDPLKDEISKVEVLEVMGSDLTVINAARVSLGKHHTEFDESDEKLIKYLAAHRHWTPFGHPQIQLRIKMPIFVAREWYRHTVGLIRNELSRRYVDTLPEFYMPQVWRTRPDKGIKQGSGGKHPQSDRWAHIIADITQEVSSIYIQMLDEGIAPEMARMVLPQSMYTEFYETGSLAAYARICGLRIAPDAQQETRRYAEAVSELIAPYFEHSWAALTAPH